MLKPAATIVCGTALLVVGAMPATAVAKAMEHAVKTYPGAAHVDLGHALADALGKKPGQALSGALVDENGKPVYRVQVLDGGAVTRYDVDAASGKILATHPGAALYAKQSADVKKEWDALGKAHVTLAAAIARAVGHVNGKAVQAGLERDFGRTFYRIGLLRGKERYTVDVNTQTGEIIGSRIQGS